MILLAVLAFLTELAALVILGCWGGQIGPTPLSRGLLMVATPLGLAVVWRLLLAPRARVRLDHWPKLLLKVLVFALVTLAAAALWGGWVPWAFGLAASLSLLGEFAQPRPA